MRASVAVTAWAVLTLAAGPARAADDGFAAFWKAFAGAAAKDDGAALSQMTALGPGLGPSASSFAKFHAAALGAKARACLTKAKPKRDVDGTGQVAYDVFCGEVIYTFSRTTAGWRLTDMGAND
ncbi:MAG TPA: hypothetical protein VMT68_08900 [Caulobacteraceae bacterium]|nr:hypothetical protein [Caulobacteraceae bacterium]